MLAALMQRREFQGSDNHKAVYELFALDIEEIVSADCEK